MSFPRYSSYKDSGIEWLGEVPKHWTIIPLKRDLLFLTSGSRGWADHYSDDGALFIRIGNLTRHSIRLNLSDVQRVTVPEGAEGERTRLAGGDILFSITAYLGSVAVVPEEMEPAYVSQHLALVRLRGRYFLPKWIAYVALSDVGKAYLEAQGYGGTKIQLSLDDVASLLVPVPSIAEQAAIAAFLYRETAKIDALMEEQQRLIELLQEKRQAIVSHVVTKGLDPNAPMKHSGVDWLGEVPEHWEVTPLKRLTREGTSITYGIVQAGPDVEGGIPYIRTSDMANDQLPADGYLRTSPEIDASYARSRVNAGDVVIAIRATIGKPLIVPPFLEGANLTQGTAKFSPGSSVLAAFICFFLRGSQAMGQFERLGKGATFKEITLDMLRKFQVLRPPLAEQRQLVDFLTSRTAQLDCLISEAEDAVALLQERRAAMISAAVTGKIDVRGLVEGNTRAPEVVAA